MLGLEEMFGEESSFTALTDSEKRYFVEIIREEMRVREGMGKCEQVREVVPIELWINSPFFIGPDVHSIYPYWKDLICDIFSNKRDNQNKINQVILSGCFTGDTKVRLADGTNWSMKELYDKYHTDVPLSDYFYVYSWGKGFHSYDEMIPAMAYNINITKRVNKLAKITFSTGDIVKCTTDHLFLLVDGSYIQAKRLTPDSQLRSAIKLGYQDIRVRSVEIIEADELVYDFEVKTYHNFLLSCGVFVHNSIGTGKSTCSELIMLRKLYELSCFRNVNSMFHLMSKTNIMLFFFSINKTQAESTAFGEFRSLVDHSPYFNQHFKRRQRLDSLLVFPEGITVAFGSRSSDSTGMTVISALLDEANFIGGDGSNKTGNTDKALEMYAGMVNRANSRFIVDGGLNHSLNILVSSSTHESSATERQIAISRDDPHTVIAAPSQWEVKPDKFSKEYFYVLKGTNYLEPQIINSVDDVNNFRLSEGLPITKYIDGDDSLQKIEEEIEKLPPHQQAKFLRVPIDLRRGFEMNIVRSLQDLGGVSTGTTGKLFNSPAVFDDCIDPKLKHPFISQEIIVSTGDQLEIKNYLRNDFRLVHPERPRYIHIDQSTRTDSTGISCVYASDILDTGDGVKKPVFSVDFMLRINPPKPPKKIAIYKIRNFVIFLSRYMGMKIGRVTYDIFNSEESRQILEEMGFNVGYQSVDRSDKAYLDLVEIMYEGRLRIYDYPILRHELFNLIHYRDKRKVDHPATVKDSTYSGKGASVGSKDVSDSLCLTGDTEIILASGGYIRIDRLAQRNPDEFFVVSRDMRGLLVPGRARKARMTKKTKDIVEVRLSNNMSFRCTPDHKIMLADGTYKEAKDLVPESDKLATSSMLRGLAIYPISVISISLKDEIQVYDISVDGYHNFELACGVFVHNCGAVENALQIPIAVETGTNSTLKDFLAANQFRGGFEPDPMNIEELVDKQIDDMIEEMEFGRSGLGSFGGLRGF